MKPDVIHRLRHRLHWQPIEVVTEWRGDELWIGARCVICGEVSGWHTHCAACDGDTRGECIRAGRCIMAPP